MTWKLVGKIIELIAPPGAGKSSVANYLNHSEEGFYLIRKKTFLYKVVSQILFPFSSIIFLIFFVKFIKQVIFSDSFRNFYNIFYFMSVTNYQLLRLFEAKILSLFKSTVLIDEGFYFNILRLKTYLGPDLDNKTLKNYINVIEKFGIRLIFINVDVAVSAQRFFDREKDSNLSQIFERWHTSFKYPNTKEQIWLDFEKIINFIKKNCSSYKEVSVHNQSLARVSEMISKEINNV